ncbi:hypothetical protein H0N96_00730 [Candidatus Micrarchaeota archaeon]|nr:hypothetical protein [Candidatus Micrarchaeota archaeon]
MGEEKAFGEQKKKTEGAAEAARELVSNEFASVTSEFKEFSEKFHDPVVVGTLLWRLSEEKASNNMVLKEIQRKLEKLDELEARLKRVEKALQKEGHANPQRENQEEVLLPEVDEQIMSLVKTHKRVTASDIQKKLGYKGANAASARLNSLFKQGLLDKKQVGRKVFFTTK